MECTCRPGGNTGLCHIASAIAANDCHAGKCGGWAQKGSDYCQGHIKLMKEKKKMNTDECFWIVWGPNGRTNPKCKYDYPEAAQSEAERMARVYPGNVFYVLKAQSISVAKDVVTNVLKEPSQF